jgi:hypothetical protein
MTVKNFFFAFLLVFLCFSNKHLSASAGISSDVYAALQAGDTAKINAQLKALEISTAKEKDAYRGALIMKKSGLVKSGREKLSLFKKGRMLLESSIRGDSLNAEYRFLRLLIQENVPDFLNYHSKKEEDAKLIRGSFRKLHPELQEAIKNYSLQSRVLKPGDFQK